MNNQRSLPAILVTVLIIGGVMFFGYRYLYVPHRDVGVRLETLEVEVENKEREFNTFKNDQARLAKWNKLSLPKNPDLASAEYAQMLKPLLRDAGLTVDDFKAEPPPESRGAQGTQKKPQHQTLTFKVRARGTLEALTKATESLRRVPVMHRVRQAIVDRIDAKDKGGKLNVQLTIEAMIVAGSDNHPKYQPSSATQMASMKELQVSERNFKELPLRDPFVGFVAPPPPPAPKKEVIEDPDPGPTGPDQREYIRVDTIMAGQQEASMYNRAQGLSIRLKSKPRSGFDIFRVMDDDRAHVLVKGKVLRIDSRDIYFQVADEVYAIHIGQTLADSMRLPIGNEEIARLELTKLIDEDFAKEAASEKTKKSKKGSTVRKGAS